MEPAGQDTASADLPSELPRTLAPVGPSALQNSRSVILRGHVNALPPKQGVFQPLVPGASRNIHVRVSHLESPLKMQTLVQWV